MPAVTLQLKRSADQQAALESFLTEVQYKGTSTYHAWLSPAEFAGQFAPSQSTLDPLLQWLQSSGLQVDAVASGGMTVRVSGTARAVESAFAVALHRYGADGTLGTPDAPSIPFAFGSLVSAVSGLDGRPVAGSDGADALAIAVNANTAATVQADAGGTIAAAVERFTPLLEEASAQGQTVLLLHAEAIGSPVRALAVKVPSSGAQALARSLSLDGTSTSSDDAIAPANARPDWQAAPGLPADDLRDWPDASADAAALSSGMQSIVAKAGRQGEVAATFYALAPVDGVFSHAEAAAADGSWDTNDGLGTVDVAALIHAWPLGATSSNSAISLSSRNVTHGQSITLTATVTSNAGGATPTGSVTFASTQGGTLGSANLDGNGVATYTTNQLLGGLYGFYGTYSGDGTYAGSTTNTDTGTISPEQVSITPTAPTTGLAVGGTIAVSVAVASPSGVGTPSGTVTVYAYGTDVSSTAYTGTLAAGSTAGTATTSITVPASNAGMFTFQANCTSNASFSCNVPASFAVTIAKAIPVVTLTQGTASTSGTALSATVTAPAGSVVAPAPSGTVTFSDNGSVIGAGSVTSGKATFTAPATTGTTAHTYTANFQGDSNYTTASSTTTSSTTTPTSSTSTTLAATLSPVSPIPYGYDVNVVVTVTPATGAALPAGNVMATIAGVAGATYMAALTSATGDAAAKANISFPVPVPGTYMITVSCVATSTFTCAAPVTLTLITSKGNTTTTLMAPAAPQAGVPTTVTATVANSGTGSGVYNPTGTVTFTSNGKALGTAPVSGGKATTALLLTTTAAQSLTAVYSGDTNFFGSNATAVTVSPTTLPAGVTVTSSVSAPVAGMNVNLTATVSSGVAGAVVQPTGTVSFYDSVNGTVVQLGTATLVSNGLTGSVAVLSTTGLRAGNHMITAVYAGDVAYAGGSSGVTLLPVTDYTVSIPLTPVTVKAGQSAVISITLSALNGYTLPVSLSCLPPSDTATTCSVSPSVLSPGGTAQVTITTTAASAMLHNTPLGSSLDEWNRVAVAGGLGIGVSLLFARRRRIAILLMLLCAATFFTGCGLGTRVDSTANTSGSSSSSTSGSANSGTPLGTQSFTIISAPVDPTITSRHTFVLPVTVQ